MGNFVLSQLYSTPFNKDWSLVLNWGCLVLVGDWTQAHGNGSKDHSKIMVSSIHSKPSVVFR